MLKREKKTVGYMIQLYCEKQRHHKNSELCTDCKQLLEYIVLHLEKCPFQEKKQLAVDANSNVTHPTKGRK
jgi:hypothetical protein